MRKARKLACSLPERLNPLISYKNPDSSSKNLIPGNDRTDSSGKEDGEAKYEGELKSGGFLTDFDPEALQPSKGKVGY